MMNGGWLELESDPGVFTLLVQELGTKGVQVEEVYDLQKPIEGPVYGFIFLFKWIEERRARRKVQSLSDDAYVTNPGILKDMFFAHQIVPNSCATHALLSVLLNCPEITLGETLSNFKNFTKNFSPEDRGEAIGNVPEIARAHNSHAHPEPPHLPEKQTGLTTTRAGETFHFVSYVPVQGRLYELDGLKPGPLDHGPWGDKEEWTAKFQRVIAERLENEGGSSDIRFSLMAVVEDRKQALEQKLSTLRSNQQILLHTLNKLVESTQKPPPEKLHHRSSPEQPPSTRLTTTPIKEVASKQPPDSKDTKTVPAEKPASPPEGTTSTSTPDTQGEKEKTGEMVISRRKKKKKKKKKKHASQSDKGPSPTPLYRLPAALDSHNYCKSPLSCDEQSLSSVYTETDDSDSEEDKTKDEGESSAQDGEQNTSEEMINGSKDQTKQEPAAETKDGTLAVIKEETPEESEVTKADQDPELQDVDVEKVESEANNAALNLQKESGEAVATPTPKDSETKQTVTKVDDVKVESNVYSKPILSFTAKIPPDLCQPLTIHTAPERTPSSPSPSNYSTDTASEAGSAFNSPLIKSANQSRSNSPTAHKLSKFQSWKAGVNMDERNKLEAAIAKIEDERKQAILDEGGEVGGLDINRLRSLRKRPGVDFDDADIQAKRQLFSKDGSGGRGSGRREAGVWTKIRRAANKHDDTQLFTPGELLDVLKGVENEIEVYEQKLQDEKEKRNKFKVDDCRRTHNYDPFIFTFLSMLAEQGKLAGLVEKHTLIKRRQGITLGRLQRNRKPDRRRRKQRSRSIRKKSGKYK